MKQKSILLIKLLALTLLFILILTGCMNKDYTIKFKEEMILDYKSNSSACILIDTIGTTKIEESNIVNDTIQLDNFIVNCGKIDTSKVGSYTILYKTNETKNREIIQQVIVKDISPPTIALTKNIIELYQSEVEKFDPYSTDLLTISDNGDEDPSILIQGDSLSNSPGEYFINIVATDKNGNTAEKELKVIVKEEKKEDIIPKNENKPGTDSPNSPPLQNDNNNNSKTPNSVPSSNLPPAQSFQKDYLFSNGYNNESAPSICLEDLTAYVNSHSNVNGSCTAIKDGSITIGVRLSVH